MNKEFEDFTADLNKKKINVVEEKNRIEKEKGELDLI